MTGNDNFEGSQLSKTQNRSNLIFGPYKIIIIILFLLLLFFEVYLTDSSF